MKKTKFFAAVCLSSVLSLTSIFVGCGNSGSNKNAPDYSASNKQYTIWAYSGVCDDWYAVAGDTTYFEDGTRQTLEHTRWYAEAGFNILFVDWCFPLDGTASFAKSKTKEVMDMAYECGLKCIVFESNLHSISGTKKSVIDPEKADGRRIFSSQEQLNEYVANCLKEVKEHPAFYGVSLQDEPTYHQFAAWGEVAQAVKNACPDAWINVNLNPLDDRIKERYCVGGKEMGAVSAYKNYLTGYYESVGQYVGTIQYDDYPIEKNNAVLNTTIDNAQIVAEYAKEKSLTFGKVYQTFEDTLRRPCTETDMYWQLNIGMAMGIKDHSYYYYYPVPNASVLPNEDATIVNRNGDRNPLYYSLQKIHQEMQFNAKALMNFEYQGLTYYTKTPVPGYMGHLAGVDRNELLKIDDVVLDKEGIVLITELYDKDNEQYGYYFVNITDPTKSVDIKVSVDFNSGSHVQVYNGKEIKNAKMKNGNYTFTLSTGRGAFVMPY